MAVKVKRKGELWCVVEPDGTEVDKGCWKTEDEATTQAAMINSKESKSLKSIVPWGALSFEDVEIAEQSHEVAERVSELTRNFQDIMWNIMYSDIIEDKPTAIRNLAGEFADRLGLITRMDVSKMKALPDSSFLYVNKDTGDRRFLFKNKDGSLKHEVLRDAIKGVYDSDVDESIRSEIAIRARKELFANGERKGIVSRVVDAVRGMYGKEETRNDIRIWKDQGGVYRWVGRYSNNFRDDDYPVQEIISKSSHQKFVKLVDAGIVSPPKLLLWHEDGWEIGQSEWVAFDDEGFALAGGYIHPGFEELAEQIKGLGDVRMSHGMPVPFIERDTVDKTVITQHISEEITVLPGYAAANKRTGFSMLD